MNNQFIYSVLQYKHSLALTESLNLGILFSFPNHGKVYFVAGNTQRIKCVYPTFDSTIFTKLGRSIKTKIESFDQTKIAHNLSIIEFKNFINKEILPEDASSLQFSDVYVAVDDYEDPRKTIDEFSKILLPGSEEKVEGIKHNETHILKQYNDKLIKKVDKIKLDTRVRRDFFVDTRRVSLTFEIAWPNATLLHLVKPISFDLTDASFIQEKSVRYFGYLGLLNQYALEHGYLFDLLVCAPQTDNLQNAYQKALEILQDIQAPKRIITEEKFEEYSEETANNLNKELI